MNQKELTISNIQAHIDVLLDDEMRAHAFADKSHDLDFQVFRILGGYRLALDQLRALTAPQPEASDREEEVSDRILSGVQDELGIEIFDENWARLSDDVIRPELATIRADERRKAEDGFKLIHETLFKQFSIEREKADRLEREVKILRQYGNKDCISMADAEIANGEPTQ